MYKPGTIARLGVEAALFVGQQFTPPSSKVYSSKCLLL